MCVCVYLSNLHILWKLGFLSLGVGTVLYFIYFQTLHVAFSDTDKNSFFKNLVSRDKEYRIPKWMKNTQTYRILKDMVIRWTYCLIK